MSLSPVVLESLVVKLSMDASAFNRGVTKFDKKLERMSKKVTAFGVKLTAGLTLPLVGLGAIAVKTFATFDDAMTKSLSIMGDVSASMRDEMEKTALQLSGQSITAADKLAEAYFFLGSAGLGAEQSMGALATVERFAVAGAFDMAKATDLLTDAQSALGLTVDDTTQNMKNMTRVSDVLIKANTMANASAEQFAKALTTKSAAALRNLGKELEEGVAILAAFADQGIKGRNAGEKLSIVLRDLQTASRKNTKQWEQQGLAIHDADGKMLKVHNIIGQLEIKLAGMSDKQKAATFAMLGFTDESKSAIESLLGMSDAIEEYETGMHSAAGITEEVATKQLSSFSAQLKITKNLITNISIEIGKQLAPSLISLNKEVQELLKKWNAFDDSTKALIVTTGKIAASIGLLVVGVGLAIKAFVLLKAATLFLLANPIVVALAVIVTGLATLEKKTGALSAAWRVYADAIKDAFLWLNKFTGVDMEAINKRTEALDARIAEGNAKRESKNAAEKLVNDVVTKAKAIANVIKNLEYKPAVSAEQLELAEKIGFFVGKAMKKIEKTDSKEVFKSIGNAIGKASNSVLGGMVDGDIGARGDLALASTGSVSSFEQRARIRKDKQKGDQQKKMVGHLGNIDKELQKRPMIKAAELGNG